MKCKDGQVVCSRFVMFYVSKHFKFIDPKLSYKPDKDENI